MLCIFIQNEEIDVEQQKYGTEENKVKKNGGRGG